MSEVSSLQKFPMEIMLLIAEDSIRPRIFQSILPYMGKTQTSDGQRWWVATEPLSGITATNSVLRNELLRKYKRLNLDKSREPPREPPPRGLAKLRTKLFPEKPLEILIKMATYQDFGTVYCRSDFDYFYCDRFHIKANQWRINDEVWPEVSQFQHVCLDISSNQFNQCPRQCHLTFITGPIESSEGEPMIHAQHRVEKRRYPRVVHEYTHTDGSDRRRLFSQFPNLKTLMIIEGNMHPLNAPRYTALKEVDENSGQCLILRARTCRKVIEEDYEMNWPDMNSSHVEVRAIMQQQMKNLGGHAPLVRYMVCS